MPNPNADSPADPGRVHAQLIKTATVDRFLYNQLLTLYSRTPSGLPDALLLLHRLPVPPNVVSWTTVISAHSGEPVTSLHLFRLMLRCPTLPNQRTLASLLKTCASSFPSVALSLASQLHSLSLKLSLSHLPFAGSALVNAYSKSKCPNDALKVFDGIYEKDEVCYGAAIVGLAQNHRSTAALSLFARMRFEGVNSTMYSLSAVLRAAAEMAALEQTRVIHAHAVAAGLEPNVVVGTALVHAYGKSGVASDARWAFNGFHVDANLVAWNALLAAYAQQGDQEATIHLFEEMLESGLRGDEFTFLAILTAYGNAGSVSETDKWLGSMATDYGVAPGLEHYTCLVGAMARVGRLEEAERLAQTMPFEPDAAVWRTLLTAAVMHGKADIAQAVGQRLLEIDPQDDSAYVMLANVYAASGTSEEVSKVWTTMRDRGVKKEGGRSWIELRGKVHVFVAEDRRHYQTAEIYAKLVELIEEIRKLGYKGKEEEGFWYHSEKLALAFGVLSGVAPEGKPLRVVKNLRICGDCHEAFKYFSRLVEREIVVRDVNRYHRFENGVCTCGDLW